MSITAHWKKYRLQFNKPAGTSRGTYHYRDTWFLLLNNKLGKTGIGECAPLPELSCDATSQFEPMLDYVCANINQAQALLQQALLDFPSIRFGLEMALLDLQQGGHRQLFNSDFTQGVKGITTNGLIWMGNKEDMAQQIENKMAMGFQCIKMKIGNLDMQQEFSLLQHIRQRFDASQLELRVDANGAYRPQQAQQVLHKLAELKIHSIEQPIRQGQQHQMADLCREEIVDIALDEELIGVNQPKQMAQLLDTIKPQAIVLKPSLHGGIAGCQRWIKLADERNIYWWLTSALESNIGLNAIAQWSAHLGVTRPQGLGTGGLFTNNLSSPLTMQGEQLCFSRKAKWQLNKILKEK